MAASKRFRKNKRSNTGRSQGNTSLHAIGRSTAAPGGPSSRDEGRFASAKEPASASSETAGASAHDSSSPEPASHPVFVFASDSFKGTLSSQRTAELLTEEARKVFPQAECRQLIVADGGEGTTAAIAAQTGAERVDVRVQGPMVVSAPAQFALLPGRRGNGQGKTAVLDMASASGLMLVPANQRDPLQASSYGTGQLIRAALDAGARELYIGLGGSATVDGGMGMLAALGVRFWDTGNWVVPASGANLADVASVDTSGLDPRLADCTVHALCDVDNPLLGENGAARTFAPQKGADPAAVDQLEAGMTAYARAVQASVGEGFANLPGAGAAGGLGFALAAVLHASLEPGIRCVLDLIGFDRALRGADFCVTGEGRLDAQTLHGKAVAGIAARCKRAGVPCAALVGSQAPDADEAALAETGIRRIEACVPDGTPAEDVETRAEETYRAAAHRLFESLRG